MAFENITAEVELLVNEMQNEADDPREIHLIITEQLAELRAYGLVPPADLIKLEKALRADLTKKHRLRKPH